MSSQINTPSQRGEESDNARTEASFGELPPQAARSGNEEEARRTEGGATSPAAASTSAERASMRSSSHAKRTLRGAKSGRSRSSNGSRTEDQEPWVKNPVPFTISDSSGDESDREREGERDRKRKRGKSRPAKVPEHESRSTSETRKERKRLAKAQKQEADEERGLDPTITLRHGPRLAKACREEQEMLLEFKKTSPAGLSAIVTEQVAMVRKVAQCCTNLKGTTIKVLWDATISISAAATALNLRAQTTGQVVTTPEWEELREEVRQLRGDMSHLRMENDALKAELRKERAERKKMEREKREKERTERERKEMGAASPARESSLPPSGRPKRQAAIQRRRVVDRSEDEGGGRERCGS